MGDQNPSVDAAFVPGTYEVEAPERYGGVKAIVTMGDHAIEGIEIVSFRDMNPLAETALAVLAKKIVAMQSIDTEPVSGAKQATKGLLMCVEDALAQAGGSADMLVCNPEALDIEQHMVPGTYEAEASGYWPPHSVEGGRFGAEKDPRPVKVKVTVDETAIKDFEILVCDDVPHFKKPVLERMPKAIIDSQSIFVDTVTGSTICSAGVLAAGAKALEQAGADLLGFAKSPERKTDVVKLSCDVVVVGAGSSGCVAAQSAIEQGLDTIVIEKTGRVGGLGFCIGGISAVGAKIEQEAGVTLTTKDFVEDLHEQSGGRTNGLLVEEICGRSGETVDWLAEHGFEFTPPSPDAVRGERYMCATGKHHHMFEDLIYKYFIPKGGKLFLETAATELVMDGKRIVGVKARQQDGTTLEIACKAAILATGGFGANPDMLRRFCQTDNFYDRGFQFVNTGDSITMCEAVGAQLGPEIMPHLQEFAANAHANFTATQIKFITYAGFFMVNPEGKRFMDEGKNVYGVADATATLRIQGRFYVILDQDQIDTIIEKGINGMYGGNFKENFDAVIFDRALVPMPRLQEDLNDAIAAGEAWKADSPEELAAAIGFARPEIFVDAFKRYNELCETREDVDFGKIPMFMNKYSAPLYAVRCIIPIMGTLGGVRVNERMEVLNMNDEAIPGLYVVGQEGSGFYSYPYYITMGSTATYAYVGGYISGLNAADYIASNFGGAAK